MIEKRSLARTSVGCWPACIHATLLTVGGGCGADPRVWDASGSLGLVVTSLERLASEPGRREGFLTVPSSQ